MNEQMQGKIVEILTSIQAATKQAGDFALEQLPEIAQQYVLYGRAMHTVGLVFGVLLAAALIVLAVKKRESIFEMEVWPIPVFVFGGAAAFIAISVNFGAAMLVWFAPKVWLLQEVAHLVK
jgi:hypothetical protein